MIEVNSIYKSYGKVEALKNISFSVEDGEIFGIIGPDGAGKTSLFRILTSLILPDKGSLFINDIDVCKDYKKIRQIVGYMPGTFSLYHDLTVEENLTFFATIFGTTIEENYHLIKEIYKQIEPFKNRRAGSLSGGMKQKLALSCALIHKPEVLILDEPTTGVDPVSRKEFWEMLKKLKQENITIMVSTAYMDEATLCDRIALIKDGQFIATDTPQGIIDGYSDNLWAVEGSDMILMLNKIREYVGVKRAVAFGDKIHVTVKDELTPEQMHQFLIGQGFRDAKVYPITPTVEDSFMELADYS